MGEGKRKRGRPKRRFMDAAREDMAVVEVREQDTDHTTKWRCKLRCGKQVTGEAARRRFP